MNSCTCKTERECAERLRNALRQAYRALMHEQDVLIDLYERLRILSNKWILLACSILSILHPKILLACLALAQEIFELRFKISVQKERIEEKKKICDKVKNAYDRAQEKYLSCKNSLKKCKGCEEEFKPKPECIKTCRGCGYDYCNGCFDAGIEAWEMKQKENV